MKMNGLFGSMMDRIKNIVPRKQEPAWREGDAGEYPPEEYYDYPGEGYDAYPPEPPYGAYPGEEGYSDYPLEPEEPQGLVYEELPFEKYFPQAAAPAEGGEIDAAPEGLDAVQEEDDALPEEYGPGTEPPDAPEGESFAYDPEDDVIGQMTMDDLPPVDYPAPAPKAGPEEEETPEDVPVEEFSLDELDEDTPPENLPHAAPTAEAAPDPAPETAPEDSWDDAFPEYSEELLPEDPRRRPRLLSRKGRLRHPGWETEDLYEYNKENLRFPARRKEWELYQMSNERFAFSVTYGHAAYMSLVDVTLVDFATGERFSSGKRRFFPGDSLDLDFSGGQPHSLKYEDGDLFLSISFDGDVRRILVRSSEFEADLTCHDAGDAIVTAVPFDFPGEFSYNYKKVFLDLSGHLTMHNVPQKLDGDTFLMLYSGRGIWPYRYTTIWAAGAQETEDGVLALNLSGDYGGEDAPTENALFLNGKLEKLEGIRFKFSSENYQKPWHITDRNHRVRLTFRPTYDDYTSVNWLLVHNTCHRLYGHLSGTVQLSDGTVREIRDMVFTCRHEINRW